MVGKIPVDKPLNIIYVGYSFKAFEQTITVSGTPKTSFPIHSTKSQLDIKFKDFLSSLKPNTDLSLDGLSSFFEETLLKPFQFSIDCQFSAPEIFFSYLYYLGTGHAKNSQSLIRELGGEDNATKHFRVWNQVHYLGVFAISLQNLFFQIEGNTKEIKNALYKLVSCVPLNSVKVYQLLLRALKLGIQKGKLRSTDVHNYILFVVGRQGYAQFCKLIGLEVNTSVQSQELVQSLFHSKLSNTFDYPETKTSQLVYDLERYNELWGESAFGENVDLSKFDPPKEYRDHISNIFVRSPLFI